MIYADYQNIKQASKTGNTFFMVHSSLLCQNRVRPKGLSPLDHKIQIFHAYGLRILPPAERRFHPSDPASPITHPENKPR